MQPRWKQYLKYNLFLILPIVLTVLLSRSFGLVPALGPLINPFTGFWSNVPISLPEQEILNFEGLQAPVKVAWNENRVPQIFAETDADLYRAQGYIHARDRLFQMEVTSRAGVGKLSELVGWRGEKLDTFMIKIGARIAARNTYKQAMADVLTRTALENYAEGANLWIKNLAPKDYPVEYKILGTTPSLWAPRRTVDYYVMMSFRLSGHTKDMRLTRLAQKFGVEKALHLFPPFNDKFTHVPFPEGETGWKTKKHPKVEPKNIFVSTIKDFPYYLQPFEGNGSNNWAASSKVTSDGHTYLANDIHLRYTLPSIGYESRLKGDKTDCYGISFPGSPGCIIGFNKNFGWMVTNGRADVIDWYEMEFKDDVSMEYKLDGQWMKGEPVVEDLIIRGRPKKTLATLMTKAGLIYYREGNKALAMNWIAYQPSNAIKTFYLLSQAQSRKECENAIRGYSYPPQNILCGDKDGISIQQIGVYPKRKLGEGMFVMDGTDSKNFWKDFVGFEDRIYSANPKLGYLYSANNRVAPKDYQYFMNWDFLDHFRVKQIRWRLKQAKSDISFNLFKDMQNDTFSLLAEYSLPKLFQRIYMEALSQEEIQVLDQLKTWKFRVDLDQIGPTIFHTWWKHLYKAFYKEKFGDDLFKKMAPKAERTLVFLKNGNMKDFWFLSQDSDKETEAKLSEIITQTFRSTVATLKRELGADTNKWTWAKHRPTSIHHILKLPGFSTGELPIGGTEYTVLANSSENGPTWRQIVKLGETFEAQVNYPGGQSGNPFSQHFSRFVVNWAEGKFRNVTLHDSFEEAVKQ